MRHGFIRTALLISFFLLCHVGLPQSNPPAGSQSPLPFPAPFPAPFIDPPASESPSTPAERYDILSIKGSSLQPVQPLLGEKTVSSRFTRELWRLQWRAQDPIDVYVIKPIGIARPPVTLFLYGYPTDTARFRDDSYCAAVTKNGVAAIGFVSALTGQRYHDRPWKQWLVSELPESLGASVHDVQMILNFLDAREDLDMQRVGIFGQGSGGTIAILAAATDPRIKAVDVLDPWGDWNNWLRESPLIPADQRSSYLTADFAARLINIDPLKALPLLSQRSVRLQVTAFDEVTPAIVKDHLQQALPNNSTYTNYKSVDEYAENAAREGKILQWLSIQLQSLCVANTLACK